MNESRIADCAALLRQAAKSGPLAGLPDGVAPADEAEAYAVQTAFLGERAAGGWKVGAVHAPGPFVCSVLPAALADARLPGTLFHPEVEVELGVMLKADLPERAAPWTVEDILPALGPGCTAIEVLDSRFENRVAAPPLAALADLGSSGAVRLGAPAEGWQDMDLTAQAVTMTIDGQERRTQGNATVAQTLAAIAWLANHAAARGLPLRAGQFVITGARLGPFAVSRGQKVEARFGPLPAAALSS